MKDSIDHFTGDECLNLVAVQNERAGGGRAGEEGQTDKITTKLVSQAASQFDPETGRIKERAVAACAPVSGQAGAMVSVWTSQDIV